MICKHDAKSMRDVKCPAILPYDLERDNSKRMMSNVLNFHCNLKGDIPNMHLRNSELSTIQKKIVPSGTHGFKTAMKNHLHAKIN